MAETLTRNGNKLNKVNFFPLFKKSASRSYPESEGWKAYNRFNWISYLHDFVLQRESEGLRERILVEIVTEKVIQPELVTCLEELARRLEHDGTQVSRCILVVNDEASLPEIPRGMEVMRLSTFVQSGISRLSGKPEQAGNPVNGGKSGGSGRMVA
jgi:hypothetical protein